MKRTPFLLLILVTVVVLGLIDRAVSGRQTPSNH